MINKFKFSYIYILKMIKSFYYEIKIKFKIIKIIEKINKI